MITAVPFQEAPDATRQALIAAAAADKHAVILPTHVFVKAGKVVGYCACGAPTIFFWSKTANSPRDTFGMMDFAEANTPRPFAAPCATDSPLIRFLPKRGYTRLGNADWFLMAA
jgi:hypothetical protein